MSDCCDIGPGDLRWRFTLTRQRIETEATDAGWSRSTEKVGPYKGAFRRVQPRAAEVGAREQERRRAELIVRTSTPGAYNDLVDIDNEPRRYRIVGVEEPYKQKFRRYRRLVLAYRDVEDVA